MIDNIHLNEHINALLREVYYLKENGSAKYKITNGQLVKKTSLSYWYSFELETDAPFYEDSSISITIGDKSTKGTVYYCDNLQIIIITSNSLGNPIPVAYISAEPWTLLEKLVENLKCISSSDKIAYKLIESFSDTPLIKDYNEIPKGQEKAKEMAKSNDITIIWGPPGTGKTHVISEIALSAVSSNKKVLIVSNSNVSVDNIILKIANSISGSFQMNEALSKGMVLRYGYVKSDELSDQYPDAVSLQYTLRKHPELTERRKALINRRKEIKHKRDEKSQRELSDIAGELKDIRKKISFEEKINIKHASILATTISKLYMDSVFDARKYDYVIVDEVSMAYVSQVFSIASYASEHLICVGDFYQLAPIAVSEVRKTLQTDIFTYLGISNTRGDLFYHPWLVLLDIQRRMYPKVSGFSRKYIYKSLISDYDDTDFISDRERIISFPPLSNESLNMISITGMNCASSMNDNNSRYNIISALLSFGTALSSRENKDISVGIITPYNAQAKLIKAMINDLNINDPGLVCSTVHQFQGSEKDIIILDSVESYPSAKIGRLLSSNENNAVSRLVNVAITRARAKFSLIANKLFWEKHTDQTNKLYCLIKHIEENGNIVKASGENENSLSSYISNLDYGNNIKFFSDYKTCKSDILEDILNAKKTIIVMIPDSKFSDNSEMFILDKLKKAMERGVIVKIKARENTNLPFSWKQHCVISDNANFPIVIIDDVRLWYGVPVSRGRLSDGKSGTETVCNAIYRIEGKKTLKIIRELIEPEATYTAKSDEDSISQQFDGNNSLGSFLRNTVNCDSCSHKMKMVKSQYGKPYLKCTKCSETKLISKELVNEYINEYSPQCPNCHSMDLLAGISQYGIYVRCNTCQKYIKLFEI